MKQTITSPDIKVEFSLFCFEFFSTEVVWHSNAAVLNKSILAE
jgi:hypothetical protein